MKKSLPHESPTLFSTSYKLQATSCSRGFTLFYAVLISSLLLSIALAVFNITLKELILSSDARESQNAFYSADSALECALFWDNGPTPAFGFYGDSLASGITNYWRFDEGEDEEAFDTGSGNNDGVLLPDDTGPTWISGHTNDALSFDGVDDYVGLEETTTYSDAFTVSMWMRPTFTTASQLILAGAAGRFGFRYNAATAQNEFRTAIGAAFINSPFTTSLGGSWNHVVFRREEDNDVQIIINGGEEVITVGTQSGDFDLDFIGQNSSNSNYFTGDLDDIRIYNRALSDEEIEAITNGTSNNIFVDPLPQESNVVCAGADISDPDTGWDVEEGTEKPIGWDTVTDVDSAITTFDMSFENGRCAYVTVTKNTASTTIVARGYNTCGLGDNRRLERALRAEY